MGKFNNFALLFLLSASNIHIPTVDIANADSSFTPTMDYSSFMAEQYQMINSLKDELKNLKTNIKTDVDNLMSSNLYMIESGLKNEIESSKVEATNNLKHHASRIIVFLYQLHSIYHNSLPKIKAVLFEKLDTIADNTETTLNLIESAMQYKDDLHNDFRVALDTVLNLLKKIDLNTDTKNDNKNSLSSQIATILGTVMEIGKAIKQVDKRLPSINTNEEMHRQAVNSQFETLNNRLDAVNDINMAVSNIKNTLNEIKIKISSHSYPETDNHMPLNYNSVPAMDNPFFMKNEL